MTIYETVTRLEPAEVLRRARAFFPHVGTPYTASPELAGSGFLRLRLDMGEVVIGAFADGDVTRVRGSASRGGHHLSRFFAAIGAAEDVREAVHRAA